MINLEQQLTGGLPFQPGTWWIDEIGVVHQPGPLNDLAEGWFLRKLGQIRISLAANLVEISWDTGGVESVSLEKIKFLLSMLSDDARVRLIFYYHGWANEFFYDAFSALERLDEIQHSKSVSLLHETRIRDCSLSDIKYTNPRIRQGYRCWEKTSGCFDKIDQNELSQILPHSLIFKSDEREENLVYSWVGRNSIAATLYGEDWVKDSIGQISHHAFGSENQSFADKVDVGIVKTMNCGEPLYQHVRTLVCLEDQDPFWFPYERLLTRHFLRNGTPIVMVDVNPTQYVDISFAGSP